MTNWDAQQYLKFVDERTRPARDLLAQVPIVEPACIYDLGCGRGNSSQVLHARFPHAHLIGVDFSPDMLARAKATLPDIDFLEANLNDFRPDRPAELYFANSVLQWLPNRLSLMERWLGYLAPGGVLAVQMPDNLYEPCHILMREIAARGPWAARLAPGVLGRLPIEAPRTHYDCLKPLCAHVEIWNIVYNHVLTGADALTEWLIGAGLRPYLDLLDPEEAKAFLETYQDALAQAYPPRIDGKILFRFPRLFIVAVKS